MSRAQRLIQRISGSRSSEQSPTLGEDGKGLVDPLHDLGRSSGHVGVWRSGVGNETVITVTNSGKAGYVSDRRSGNAYGLKGGIGSARRSSDWSAFARQQAQRRSLMPLSLDWHGSHIAQGNGLRMIRLAPLRAVGVN